VDEEDDQPLPAPEGQSRADQVKGMNKDFNKVGALPSPR